MKIDDSTVGIGALFICSLIFGFLALGETDPMDFTCLMIADMFCLVGAVFIALHARIEKLRREIADLHLGIEEVIAINDELRREIDAQKVEKQENP